MLARLSWMRLVFLALLLAAAGGAFAQKAPPPPLPQDPLVKDSLHDPSNPGIKMLQEPREGMAKLPKDYVGNRVDWVQSLRQGLIQPRTNVTPSTAIRVLDQDVLLPRTGEMPMVLFPHRQHTEWLDCSNCHEALFKSKTGTTKGLNMFAILQGEFCGRCHGAVAFPLTECRRCHSVPRK
jgi:c(7)-type cytochrome triheme protein